MNSISSVIKKLSAHIVIILGLDLLTLLIIDIFFNSAMNFVNNAFFKWGCMAFVVFAVILACSVMFEKRRKDDQAGETDYAASSDTSDFNYVQSDIRAQSSSRTSSKSSLWSSFGGSDEFDDSFEAFDDGFDDFDSF